MDRVFVCGVHDKESIASELARLLHEKGCSITDLQVVKVEEGIDLDFKTRVFDDIMDLAEVICAGLKIFETTYIMIGKEVNDNHSSVAMYLMFTNTNDPDLFDALSKVE
jgi:hypothetical protein